MVGVPGKFKGCETCRKRRVPCDNERPFCRKCTKNNHHCEGYERPIMFITGTPEGKGRVSIHPKKPSSTSGIRKAQSKASSSPRTSPSRSPSASTSPRPSPPRSPGRIPGRYDIVLAEPLASAWEDVLFLSSHGIDYMVRIAALYTKLDAVVKAESMMGADEFTVSVPAYVPPDVHPRGQGQDFEVGSQCLLNLMPAAAEDVPATSLCLFLFEQNSSMAQDNNLAPWKIPQSQLGTVRKLGPDHFRQFPHHHYFVRVFRPAAIMMALLSRKDTFLSSNEWRIVPWESHPKSLFDSLLDTISLLPALFARADRIIMATQPTIARRLKAQDLLANLLAIEKQFEDWCMMASQGPTEDTFSYWIQDPDTTDAQIPFSDNFAFKDGVTAVSFLYYWAAQVLFHQCIDSLNRAIFEPVVDAFPQMYPDLLSPGLLINPAKYQQTREIASNICRGLDSALAMTVQPDLLVAPLTVATDLFERINHVSAGGDGALEMLWCEGLKARVMAKGDGMAGVIQMKSWRELARF